MDNRIEFVIRPFGLEETSAMTAISADVGWNQPETEIREIIRRSGKYLLGAFHDGKLIGTAAAYPYPDGGFAYINEVIVLNAWRKHGAATQLLEHLLPLTAKDYPTLRLCATDLGRPIYEKFGFQPFDTLSFGEMAGTVTPPDDCSFAPLQAADLSEASELDAKNFGAHRPEILRKVFDAAPNAAWCLRQDGKQAGFIIRASMNWFLQAEDADTFTALLRYAETHGEHLPVLIRSKHRPQLPAPINEHFKLTLMQYGISAPVPPATFSGFLPDIG